MTSKNERTENLRQRVLKTVSGQAGGAILALGELLIDLVPGAEGMLIRDQGPVIKTVSGSAGIFACAAQLLGGSAGFLGKLGRDSLSRMARDTMEAQGVDVSGLTTSDEGQIGLAFLEYTPEGRNYQYYRTRSVGSLLRPEDLDEEKIAAACMVHYPGMLLDLTDEMRSSCERLVALAEKHGVPVSFDPNLRRELGAGSLERVLHAVRHAAVVAPTLQEARLLTGKTGLGDVIRALHAMGPKVVAVTRDKDGAAISMDGICAIAEGIDLPAVDPTGAGDTLAAALCVGLREGMPVEKLAAFCNCAGTLAVTKRGAIGMALPTRAEVERLMVSGACRVRLEKTAEMA